MKNFYLALIVGLISCLVLFSCSTDDKAIDQVFEGITYGSWLRTIQFEQADLDVTNLTSEFSVTLEEQDFEDGALLEYVEVYISFKDNTTAVGDFSTQEVALATYTKDQFVVGSVGLPRIDVKFTLANLLAATNLNIAQIACKDQFIMRFEVFLIDGRSFTVGSGAPCIIAFETYFSSPYRFLINLVEPINPDLFTGVYLYTSELNGQFGPTFGPSQLVEVFKGEDINTRYFQIPAPPGASNFGNSRKFKFTIACDEIIFWENQLKKLNQNCSEIGNEILLGPGSQNATLDPLEDSVFEIWLVEGYMGWDGGSDTGAVPSKIRFDKQ